MLFTLGSLQVFHWQTPVEVQLNSPAKEIYWRDSRTGYTYGPFPTINESLSHYKWLISTQKSQSGKGQVIYVDFVLKKRVVLTEEVV